jgi:hypothetical protein
VVAVYAPNDEAARRAFFGAGGPLLPAGSASRVDGSSYTYFAASGSARRLDRVYVSDALVASRRLASCCHLPLGSLPGDHCGVDVALDLGGSTAGAVGGPPRWRLRLDLLDDDTFTTAIRAAAARELGGAGGASPSGTGPASSMARWLAFKRLVRFAAIDRAARIFFFFWIKTVTLSQRECAPRAARSEKREGGREP